MQKLQNLQSHRIFSEPLKRKIVKDIESGKAKVSAVLKEYQVSHTAVYKWLKQYSAELKPSTKVVLQMESEGYKTKELEKKIKELEAALGRKQLEVEFLNQMLEQGKKELGVDLKKKFFIPPSTGSGSTENGMSTR
jgi:transposase